MKIALTPNDSAATITNTGFLSKRVKVTYPVPVRDSVHLGYIPDAQTPNAPKLPNGFTSSSQDAPVIPPLYARKPVYGKEPILDSAGQPEMQAVTTTFSLPGPKAEALGDAATTTMLGALAGATPGIAVSTFGMLGSILSVVASTPTNGATCLDLGVGLMAVGATIGGAIGLGVALKNLFRNKLQPNTLSWREAPVESTTLKGWTKSEGPAPEFDPLYGPPTRGPETHIEPELDVKRVGSWKAPYVNGEIQVPTINELGEGRYGQVRT
ncbi:MAG: hypothetical protein U0931_11100 [Vulcanimicrobiota bacterium]